MAQEDLEMMTEAERKAFETVDPEEKEGEPGTTPEDEMVENEETPPPPEEKIVEKPEVEPPKEDERPVGILAKDGKNIIPFDVLEKERKEKQALAKQLGELQSKLEGGKTEKTGEIDFQKLANDIYENPETAAQSLKEFAESVRQSAQGTASQVSTEGVMDMLFNAQVETIKAENSWLDEPVGKDLPVRKEIIALLVAQSMIEEDPDKCGFSRGQDGKLTRINLGKSIQTAKDAVVKTKEIFGGAQLDEAKIRAEERDKTTKELLKKFNVREDKAKTLSSVPNAGDSESSDSKFDQLDTLKGEAFQRAFDKLTPLEQAAYEKR